MIQQPITIHDKLEFNKLVTHPLQSYEWGEFRQKTGVKVIRRGVFNKNNLTDAFQLTIHPVPHTPWTIGYLPKGKLPENTELDELQKIGTGENCIFIQLEPNVMKNSKFDPFDKLRAGIRNSKFKLLQAAHPLFTKYTFILDLTKTEDELLKAMHPKTRYNIKVAQRHGVIVKEDDSQEAFERYWQLTEETTKRQGFYAHTKKYHQLQWETFSHQFSVVSSRQPVNQLSVNQSGKTGKLKTADKLTTNDYRPTTNNLTSHLFTATYEGKILTTMLFFVFHDTLYYPYGASSSESRNVMHSTLTMWEAIRFGKKLGLKKFDMWGALGPNPDPEDPWLGFHTFKERFSPEHVEFVGSYDLVINPVLYRFYKYADKLRWLYLKLKK